MDSFRSIQFRQYISNTHPLFPSLLGVLIKEIIFPTFAATGDQEPVIVEAHLVATQLILAITLFWGCASTQTTTPLQKELIVILQ